MNKTIAELANQHFYASTDAIRAFFSSIMDAEAVSAVENPVQIAEFGHEQITIRIQGLMLRQRSWITDLGLAVSTEQVIEEIQSALDQEKRVKLVISSGGGLVSGTSNLADLIYKNRDRIDAYATDMAASAALWVYSAAGTRYAEDTTILGSIGVVTSVMDDEAYWKSHGIVWKEVVSANAKNKRPDVKTESGIAEVQRYLTSLESVFLDAVSRNFDMTKEDIISKFHEGGLITGQDALGLGVVADLTSYDDVAVMPAVPSAESKITKSNHLKGDGTMPISQEDFDAVKSQLEDATASLNDLNGQIATATARAEKAELDLATVTAKAEAMPEIVAMAYKNGVDVDTAIAMVKAGDKGEAAIICVNANTSESAVSADSDIEEPDAGADAEAEEAALAMKLAEKLSAK